MRILLVITAIAVLQGCSAAPGPQPVNQGTASKSTSGGTMGQHPDVGSSEASSSAPDQPIDDTVAQLRSEYERSPGSATAKQALVDATFQNAQFYMYKSPLPPPQKYPKALALYRDVLKLDPQSSHAEEARDAVDMIEGIYRSMGKAIPPAA